jgi:phosphoribosyl 1,2-cyclic phosphodiesterase
LLTVHSIASGSEGNSLLVSAGGTHILVDAGISARRITAALSSLGLTPGDIAGVLVTHEHSDHTAGLATLTKQYRLPLYASGGTAGALCARIPHAADVLHLLPRQGVLTLGDAQVTVFPTSHDAAESIDFRFDCGGAALGVLTDTGCVTPETEQALQGVDLLVLESNHDEDWLLSGPYPYYLKQRILGNRGHLSNDAAAALAQRMASAGTRQFVLAHLSRENNTPERARQTMARALAGLDVSVTVAPRAELSGPYIAEVRVCSE